MIELKPGDEVCVQNVVNVGHDEWICPGDRVFVMEVGHHGTRARVRVPISHVDGWVDSNRLSRSTRTFVDRLTELERRVAQLEDAAVDAEDAEEAEEFYEEHNRKIETRLRAMAPGGGRAEEPPETAAEPLDDPDWRQNPYSLPPAVREGVECPACRSAKVALGLTASVIVNHATQEDVDECVRRQEAMGGGPGVYRHL